MKLRLYVEDSYFQPYEILVAKWHSVMPGQCTVSEVRAVQLSLDKMRNEMREYVLRAKKDGFDSVMFVIDQERDVARTNLIRETHGEFAKLCQELDDDTELQKVKVSLVIAVQCFESWLLTDVQAIVYSTPGVSRAVDYHPDQSAETEKFNPQEAADEITRIWRNVGRRAGKRDLKRIKYRKSSALDIAQQMGDLSEAIRRNHSFMYFCDMAACQKSGCDYPQRL